MGTPRQQLQESLEEAFDLVTEDPSSLETEEPAVPGPRETVDPSEEPERGQYDSPAPADNMSMLPMFLGMTLLIAGFLLAAAPLLNLGSARVMGQLTGMGLTPALLVISGVLMTALAWAQVANTRVTSRRMTHMLRDEVDALHDNVLAIAQDASALRAEAGGPEQAIAELGAAVHKVEAMIAALTKAVRMHNKPLVDLVGMSTDHMSRLEQTDQSLLAIKLDLEAIEKAIGESLTSTEKKWEGMFERLHGSETELEDSLARTRDILIERLEPQIAGESRRLAGELETQWDLLREQLENGLKELEGQTRDELQALGRRLDDVQRTGGSGDTGALTALQQTLDNIRLAVENLDQRAAFATPSGTTNEAAAPDKPRQSAKTQATEKSAEPEPEPEPATASKGGRVLNAIERLKQMRSG